MRYGIIVLGEQIREVAERARMVDSLGFDILGVGDSPNGYRELCVSLAVAAEAAPRPALASMVAIPLGRHPMYVASALSSLQDLSGDRLVWGIGTGASAAGSLGLPAAPLPVLRDHVQAVRALLAGGSVEWDGATVPALKHPRPVPMYLSAYGPAARRMGGALFDGVILVCGPNTELLESFIGEVRAAAEQAGRDPADVDIWCMSRGAVRPTREEALTDIKANLASAGSFGLRSRAQMATIPEELRGAVLELQRRYDVTKHVVWDGPNAALLDELGLTDYLARRFAVVGTEEECRDQVQAIAKTGVSAVVFPATDRDPEGVISRLSQVVAAS
jgi:alkanesulfonate monooxygenase SsuD/methylene tetrahydromethanopterin reductase-like flavin-dependent oxidoreductase (luciferase family)